MSYLDIAEQDESWLASASRLPRCSGRPWHRSCRLHRLYRLCRRPYLHSTTRGRRPRRPHLQQTGPSLRSHGGSPCSRRRSRTGRRERRRVQTAQLRRHPPTSAVSPAPRTRGAGMRVLCPPPRNGPSTAQRRMGRRPPPPPPTCCRRRHPRPRPPAAARRHRRRRPHRSRPCHPCRCHRRALTPPPSTRQSRRECAKVVSVPSIDMRTRPSCVWLGAANFYAWI